MNKRFLRFELSFSRSLLIFFFLILAQSVAAQKIDGSFKLPEEVKYIRLDWDCSKTVFEGRMTEQEWIGTKGQEWVEAKREVLQKVLDITNEKLTKTRFIVLLPESELKSSYTIFICPLTLDKYGKNTTEIILKNEEGVSMGSVQYNDCGGRVGTLANLLGGGFEDAATSIASVLKKHNYPKKKK